MNVLFISSWYPNKLEPTNGNFVQRHAEAVALYNNVEVLHSIGDSNQKEKFLCDDKLINGVRTLIVYYRNSKNPIQNFLRRMQAYNLGFKKMKKPDIVHGNVMQNNMLFAVYLKEKYNIPFVISEHWSAFQEINHKHLSFSQKIILRFIGNRAYCIMPVSHQLGRSILKLGIKTKINVIGNVVDTNLFSLHQRQNKTIYTFLHISNLIPLKNPDKIINAAIKLYETNKNFKLLIGGDGDEQKLIDLIKINKAEHYIQTFGMIPLDGVAKKMKESDAFILFSIYENQPCVLLESMASGIPVIATHVGGIPEIVNEERGILVEKNNIDDLVNAMRKVLEGKTKFDSPEEIRNYCLQNFSKNEIANQFSAIYKKVLN